MFLFYVAVVINSSTHFLSKYFVLENKTYHFAFHAVTNFCYKNMTSYYFDYLLIYSITSSFQL